jgi:hypothetical protein
LARAERIVSEELKKRRWKQDQLEQRPEGDSEKVRMVERLRCETTMTLPWTPDPDFDGLSR